VLSLPELVEISDKELALVRNIKNVRHLELFGDITDKGIEALTGMDSVETLILSANMTGKSVKVIGTM